MGMHAQLDAFLVVFDADGEKFDDVAVFLGQLDVARGDTADALGEDLAVVDRGVKGQGGQDGQLVGGVVAVDVGGGIGLGVA